MAITTINNGNRTFSVRTGVELGTWGSAHFYAMQLVDQDRAEIKVSVHGHHARFTKEQLLAIAEDLTELASTMFPGTTPQP